jgi:hypothetical protein
MFAITRAEKCLSDLAPNPDRVGISDGVLRTLGQVRTNLEYRSAPEILANLTYEMIQLQDSVAEASEAIRSKYFPMIALPTWIGEVS